MSKEFCFSASFPQIQSAIKVGKDGMRIQLDIPLTDLPKAIGLTVAQECELEVTVKVLTNLDKPTNNRRRKRGEQAGAEADKGSTLGPLGVVGG